MDRGIKRTRSRSPTRCAPPPPPQPPPPATLGLLNALPEDCLLGVVSCMQSKDDKDKIALICKKFRQLGSTFRHSFQFNYSSGAGPAPNNIEREASVSTSQADDSLLAEILSERSLLAEIMRQGDDGDFEYALHTEPEPESSEGGDVDAHSPPRIPRLWNDLPEFLLQTMRAFPKVLSITIVGCNRNMASDLPIIDLSSVLVPPNFKDLTTLKITAVDGTDDHFMAQLSLVCHNLTHLNLHHCKFLTDAALGSLATHCPKLMILKLHCVHDTLTDEGVGHFLLSCAAMTTLSLRGCAGVKGSGFQNGRGLTRLKAKECGIKREDIDKGLQGAIALRTLTLAYIDGSEDFSRPIAAHCNGIEVLNLAESCGLGDDEIAHIVRSCPRLRKLGVNFCVGVSVQGWRVVAQEGLNLEELEVRGCEEFCGESLEELQNGCPSLRSLKLPNAFLPPNPAYLQFINARPDVTVEIYDDDEAFGHRVYPPLP